MQPCPKKKKNPIRYFLGTIQLSFLQEIIERKTNIHEICIRRDFCSLKTGLLSLSVCSLSWRMFSFLDRGFSVSSTGDRTLFDARLVLGFCADVIAEQLTKIETVSLRQASEFNLISFLRSSELLVIFSVSEFYTVKSYFFGSNCLCCSQCRGVLHHDTSKITYSTISCLQQ